MHKKLSLLTLIATTFFSGGEEMDIVDRKIPIAFCFSGYYLNETQPLTE